jgi:hypothetical protein
MWRSWNISLAVVMREQSTKYEVEEETVDPQALSDIRFKIYLI